MKNILLGASLLLSTSGAFAQLTVKPNAGNPSYMYVKDQIVYVEDGINLEVNPASDFEASIYLRDGGQLIQGDHGASTNSGNGYLSAQQITKPTNAYAYYYWASPVGVPGASETRGTNSNFGIEGMYQALGISGHTTPQYDPNNPEAENNILKVGTKAQPVETTPQRNGFRDVENANELTISTRWLYMRQSPQTEAEAAYTRVNSSNNVPAGFGFTMKGVEFGPQPIVDTGGNIEDDWQQLYEFRGRPNSGTFEIDVQGPVSGDPSGVGFDQRMTLAGNPYPSALDLNWVFYDSENADLGAFYYYDEDRTIGSHFYSEVPAGFATWVPSASYDPNAPGQSGYEPGNYTAAMFYIWNKFGSASGPGNTSTTGKTATRIAPIGQGILFAGNTTTQSTVKIKNSHRRFIKEGGNSIFHKPEPGDGGFLATNEEGSNNAASRGSDVLASQINRKAKLRLYVVFDDALTRDLLLTFNPEATDGFDRGYDGPSPMGKGSDAFYPIKIDGEMRPFVINGINFTQDKRIPIAFTLDKQRKIRVVVAEEVRKPYQNVYLYDSVEHRFMVLSQTAGTLSGHSFNLPAGDYLDRFFIVFNRSVGGTPWKPADVNTFKTQVDVFQNNPSQQLEIKNPYNHDIKSMNMFDMAGKLVISEKNLGERGHYSFPTGNLSDGVYIIKMTTANDMPIDYKVVIMNR